MLSHGWQGFNDAAPPGDLGATLVSWPPVGCATMNNVVPRTNTIDGLVRRSHIFPEETGGQLR
jgi:hypothetical protein